MLLRTFTLLIFTLCIGFFQIANAEESYEEKVKKLIDFMKVPEVIYLSNIGEDGWPYSRAMVNLKNNLLSSVVISDANNLTSYFITNADSRKVQQFKKNNKAGVYFYTPRINTRAVYLMGDIEVIEKDTEKFKYISSKKLHLFPVKKEFVVLKFNPAKIISYYRGTIDEFEIK